MVVLVARVRVVVAAGERAGVRRGRCAGAGSGTARAGRRAGGSRRTGGRGCRWAVASARRRWASTWRRAVGCCLLSLTTSSPSSRLHRSRLRPCVVHGLMERPRLRGDGSVAVLRCCGAAALRHGRQTRCWGWCWCWRWRCYPQTRPTQVRRIFWVYNSVVPCPAATGRRCARTGRGRGSGRARSRDARRRRGTEGGGQWGGRMGDGPYADGRWQMGADGRRWEGTGGDGWRWAGSVCGRWLACWPLCPGRCEQRRASADRLIGEASFSARPPPELRPSPARARSLAGSAHARRRTCAGRRREGGRAGRAGTRAVLQLRQY